MKQASTIHIFIFILFILGFSCKESNKEKENATKVVNEWTSKEIRFPENIPCCILGNDTFPDLCNKGFGKEFKVMLYVDSAGCSDCRLKLFQWKQLIAEADSLFPDKLSFLLFFQPKNKKEMEYLFKRDGFNYPVFIDEQNAIEQLNHFPQQPEYQCFLLDKDNKVLLIGNPVLNLKIWKLYKQTITGKKEAEPEILTTAQADKTAHDYGTIRKGSTNKAVFTITNTGSHPLIISRVSASCGCTNVNWDRQPVEPGRTASVSAEMTPDETGHFSKTVEVYCNMAESPMKLTLTGTTE